MLTHELEQRLGAALRARTYGELDPLVDDLPGDRPANQRLRRLPVPVLVGAGAALALLTVALIAVLLVAAGLFAFWGMSIVFAWLALGGRRHSLSRARPNSRWTTSERSVQAGRPGYWV